MGENSLCRIETIIFAYAISRTDGHIIKGVCKQGLDCFHGVVRACSKRFTSYGSILNVYKLLTIILISTRCTFKKRKRFASICLCRGVLRYKTQQGYSARLKTCVSRCDWLSLVVSIITY